MKFNNWAVTCDLQQCGILTCVDSEEPVQPTFKLRNSKWCSVSSLTLIEYIKWLAKALVRLCVCAGWSEALMVAHTTLLKISCRGSIVGVLTFTGMINTTSESLKAGKKAKRSVFFQDYFWIQYFGADFHRSSASKSWIWHYVLVLYLAFELLRIKCVLSCN